MVLQKFDHLKIYLFCVPLATRGPHASMQVIWTTEIFYVWFYTIKQVLAKCSSQAKPHLLPVILTQLRMVSNSWKKIKIILFHDTKWCEILGPQIKFYWNITLFICLCMAYSYFHTSLELSNRGRYCFPPLPGTQIVVAQF